MGETTQLGNFIRECRKGLKYTSRQVARLSSVRTDLPSISNSYLISVENGKHIPRLDKVIALADVLNVPVTQLVERCREDLGSHGEPPPTAEFRGLFDAARELAEGNDHARALPIFRQAWQAAAAANGSVSESDRAELHLQIANCYRRMKLNRVAKEELEAFLRRPGLDALQRARASFALADLYREEGSLFLGHLLAREAVRLAQEAKDEALEGKALSTLGNFAAEEGKSDEALAHYRDAAAKLKRCGLERAARLARGRQALILVEKRDWFRAIEMLRAELGESRDADPYLRGWLHLGLAKAYHGAENHKASRSHARSAKECADKLETPDLSFLAQYYLWIAARAEHALDLAAAAFERLKQLRTKLDVRFAEVDAFDRARQAAAPEKGVAR